MKLTMRMTALFAVLWASSAFAHSDHASEHHDETAAIGQAGKAANVTRTITVNMMDSMRFSPAALTVKQGETIRFVVKNTGKIKHEMILGTQQDLKAHEALMKKNPEMEHEDENMVTVQPGQSEEMIWQFTKAGKVNFACLQPGHYDAGMKGAVTVKGKATSTPMHAH